MAYTGSSVAGGEGNTTFNATNKLDFLGKELEIFTVDFVDAMNAQTAKGADQHTAEDTIRIYGNIVGAGPLHTVTQKKLTFLKVLTCTLVHQQLQALVLSRLLKQQQHLQQARYRLLLERYLDKTDQ